MGGGDRWRDRVMGGGNRSDGWTGVMDEIEERVTEERVEYERRERPSQNCNSLRIFPMLVRTG